MTQNDLTTELGPDVRIRQVVLNAFRSSFINKAKHMEEEYKSKGKSSVPCTVHGKGFCKEEDLVEIKVNDMKIEAKEQAKVYVFIMYNIPYARNLTIHIHIA